MSRKFKGFSLAELLIALLVISIVLSAAIPTMTRKSKSSEQIWRWAEKQSNNAYFGVGSTQTAILGAAALPNVDMVANTFDVQGLGSLSDMRLTIMGDKLAILKQSTNDNPEAHLMNSHISFYNAQNKSTSTTKDIEYAGRLALEKHNLALGIGTLQSLNDTVAPFLGYNTAVGQYSMVRNQGGQYNTALGEMSLANGVYGSNNTAVGYHAGMDLDIETPTGGLNSDYNTAIGSSAMEYVQSGRGMTAIGFAALKGVYNNAALSFGSTAVGAMSLHNSVGSGNTALGMNSCNMLTSGKYNLCLGYEAGNAIEHPLGGSELAASNNKNYMLHIGVGVPTDDRESYYSDLPLIFGRMQYDATNNLPRTVIFNTGEFEVRTIDAKVSALKLSTLMDATKTTTQINLQPYYKDAAEYTSLLVAANENDIILNTNKKGNANKKININENALVFSNDNTTKETQIYLQNIETKAKDKDFYIKTDQNAQEIILSNSGSKIDIKNGQNEINISQANTNFTKDIIVKYDASKTASFSSLVSRIETIEDRLDNMPQFSDVRLKNISGDSTAGLAEINKIEVKNYTYKKDEKKTPHVGVIAQQLQKVFPNSVFKGEDGFLRIRTEEIFYAMVNSIKELCAKLQDLAARITGLEAKVTELEKENAELKKQNADFEARLEKLEAKLK